MPSYWDPSILGIGLFRKQFPQGLLAPKPRPVHCNMGLHCSVLLWKQGAVKYGEHEAPSRVKWNAV